MALTFPRDMTTAHTWEIADLELIWRQEISMQAGGTAIGKDMGSPIWKAHYKTEPLEKVEAEAVYTDFLTLGGVARTFYAHLAGRPEPTLEAGYPVSGATVFNVQTDRDAIRIAGLDQNYTFSVGDFISIEKPNGGIELVTVAKQTGTASTGVTGWIDVAPYLRSSVSGGDPVKITPAMIELRLDVGGLKKPQRISGNLYAVEFTASQVIR